MMSYFDAFRKYAVFYGRTSRAQYWLFMLFHCIVGGALWRLFVYDATADSKTEFLLGAYLLLSAPPTICATIRRLHDTGRRGWWVLLGVFSYFFVPFDIRASSFTILIPTITGIILVLCFCTEAGAHGRNAYGADPRTPD